MNCAARAVARKTGAKPQILQPAEESSLSLRLTNGAMPETPRAQRVIFPASIQTCSLLPRHSPRARSGDEFRPHQQSDSFALPGPANRCCERAQTVAARAEFCSFADAQQNASASLMAVPGFLSKLPG